MVGQKLGRRVENEDGDGFAGVDDDTVIGIPPNEKDHYQKLGQVKLRKMFDFLTDPASKYLPLVWLVVCSPIMVIHYFLFKHGTWYNRRAGERCSIFDFCGSVERNPVCVCLCQIAAMLMDPLGGGATGLRLLRLRFSNDMRRWPRRLLAALTVALCVAFCILWRKLYHYFDCYPWRLAAGFDMNRPEEARRKTIKEFLVANLCCLDLGLGRVLRLHATSIEDYFNTVLAEFLRTFFERVVVTSTQVELQFAKLSLWTNGRGGHGARMGLPCLAARAKNTAFQNAVTQWRRTLPGIEMSNNRGRPDWTKAANNGAKTSYLHLYSRDLVAETGVSPHTNLGEHWRLAAASFHTLPQERQEKYKSDARLSRAVAHSSQRPPLARSATQADDMVEGPLGIASRKGMPMRASAVAEQQRKTSFAKVCAEWTKAHKTKTEADADFPDTVQGVRVCHGDKCTQSMFEDETEQSMEADAAHLFEYIRLVLLYFPAKNACADPMFLLQFVSDVERLYVLVVHPQRLNQSKFTAEFMMLRPVSDAVSSSDAASSSAAVHVLPMQLALAPGRVVLGVTWPHISDELQFVSRLLRTGSEWTISNMTKSISAMGQWLVTEGTVVSFEEAKDRESQVKAQQAGFAAMKKAMGFLVDETNGNQRLKMHFLHRRARIRRGAERTTHCHLPIPPGLWIRMNRRVATSIGKI